MKKPLLRFRLTSRCRHSVGVSWEEGASISIRTWAFHYHHVPRGVLHYHSLGVLISIGDIVCAFSGLALRYTQTLASSGCFLSWFKAIPQARCWREETCGTSIVVTFVLYFGGLFFCANGIKLLCLLDHGIFIAHIKCAIDSIGKVGPGIWYVPNAIKSRDLICRCDFRCCTWTFYPCGACHHMPSPWAQTRNLRHRPPLLGLMVFPPNCAQTNLLGLDFWDFGPSWYCAALWDPIGRPPRHKYI